MLEHAPVAATAPSATTAFGQWLLAGRRLAACILRSKSPASCHHLDLGGASEDGVARGGGRRPANVYVCCWDLKGPAAFDLAVTSGMRPGTLAAMAQAGDKAVVDYEVRKREHEGLQFLPLVAEACGGGWGPIAERTWRAFGSAVAAKTGEPAAAETARLLQALSLTLQRENARAILRRQAVDEQNSHVLAEP